MNIVDVVGLAGVPVIVGLVELVKKILPDLEPRWHPLVAMIFALLINVGFGVSQVGDLRLAVVYGFAAGLAASGLYSWTATAGIRE